MKEFWQKYKGKCGVAMERGKNVFVLHPRNETHVTRSNLYG